jgi:nucleotide-binding universal stress UspA family protein
MFKHLLIPLDGSRLAEAALPAALFLAAALDAKVTLIHVIEHDPPLEIHGERHLSDPEEALQYLDEVAARVFRSGTEVARHVHGNKVRNVARSIAEHGEEFGSDLIVMCTHGRGGLRAWIFGRIAQQVVGLGSIPLLLVQPAGSDPQPAFCCRRLLVTLDGNHDHEQGLNLAASLAKACKAELQMVMVVPDYKTLSGEDAVTAKILPRATIALLELAQGEAEEYLRRQATRLQAAGVEAMAEVHRGDPVTTIVNIAKSKDIDLILLATHGKTGMDAFWSGSVTPIVASRTLVPVLLFPVHGKVEES